MGVVANKIEIGIDPKDPKIPTICDPYVNAVGDDRDLRARDFDASLEYGFGMQDIG